MLEINLQEEYKKLAIKLWVKQKQRNETKQTSIPLLWCNGPPCPGWRKHLSISLSNGGAMAQWGR